MTIRAVIFDLGHTLWDITPQPDALAAAYAEFRRRLSDRLRDGPPAAAAADAVAANAREEIRRPHPELPDAEVLQRAVRDVLHEAAATYFQDAAELRQPPSTEWVDRACRSLGLEVDAAVLRELTPPLFATELDGLVCHDGTCEALSQLADTGYALGCVTNTLADEAAIRAMLRRHDVERLMRSVVVSADEGWRKPHPSLFEKALRETGAAAHEAAFVGDSPLHDIGGAKAVGMRTVLTRQYVERPPVKGVAEPDAVISHVRQLPEIVRRW